MSFPLQNVSKKVPRKINIKKSNFFLFCFFYKQILKSVLTKPWLFSEISLQNEILWKRHAM